MSTSSEVAWRVATPQGLTQAEVADACGLYRPISRTWSGVMPCGNSIDRLATALSEVPPPRNADLLRLIERRSANLASGRAAGAE